MWMHGPCDWFPLMLIFPLIFLSIFWVFLFRGGGWPMCGGPRRRPNDESAREILDRRYARGEIGQEDYQRMKKELEK